MRRALALISLGLLLAGFANDALAAETKWRISQFEVVQAEPWEGGSKIEGSLARIAQMFGVDTMDMVDVTNPLTPSTKAEMEAFLHEAAGLLQKWGFPEPRLSDIVRRDDGTQAYRIYYTNVPDASGLYEAILNPDQPFIPDVPALFVDADSVMDENGILPFGYLVLAHELFHAAQRATPFYRGDLLLYRGNHIPGPFDHAPGTWMLEGQADAVGWDIVRLLRPGMFSRHVDAAETWGSRKYSDELVVEKAFLEPPPTKGYRTSSFWRYLAEVTYAKKTPRRYATYPGAEPFPVDYSYLAHFLQRLPRTLESGDDELDWLDNRTRTYQHFRAPLRDFFGEFLAAYADYGEHRVRRTHGKGWKWRDLGFSRIAAGAGSQGADRAKKEPEHGCWFAGLSPEYRHDEVSLRIRRTAGACIELQNAGFGGELGVTITLKAENKKKLSELRIGVAGERRTAKTAWVASDGEAARTRHDFRVAGSDVSIFVLANMASTPSESAAQDVEVIFTVGGTEISGSTPDSGGGGSPPPEAEGDPDPEKAARERMARAAPKTTVDGQYTANLRRRADRDEMKITLGAVPEAAQVMGEVNISGLSALGRINPGQHVAWEEAQKLMGSITGATNAVAHGDQVRLTIPRIDHGFKGSFDEAEIRLMRSPEQDLHALDLQSCEPNGRVTIEEYSADFMRGSFSGQLVEKYRRSEDGDGYEALCEPPLTIVRNISGRFWVATPWLMDDRYEGPEPVDTLIEDFHADWMQQMGVVIPELEAMLPDRSDPPSGPGLPGRSATGGGGSAAAVLDQCDCSCRGYEKLLDLEQRQKQPGFSPRAEDQSLMRCAMTCMARYAACAR